MTGILGKLMGNIGGFASISVSRDGCLGCGSRRRGCTSLTSKIKMRNKKHKKSAKKCTFLKNADILLKKKLHKNAHFWKKKM